MLHLVYLLPCCAGNQVPVLSDGGCYSGKKTIPQQESDLLLFQCNQFASLSGVLEYIGILLTYFKHALKVPLYF